VGLGPADFTAADRVIQLGCPPLGIDLLTSIDGVEFEACHASRLDVVIDDVAVSFIGLDGLRANKAASGRPQDRADLAALDG
jgi:hypothetical protein